MIRMITNIYARMIPGVTPITGYIAELAHTSIPVLITNCITVVQWDTLNIFDRSELLFLRRTCEN